VGDCLRPSCEPQGMPNGWGCTCSHAPWGLSFVLYIHPLSGLFRPTGLTRVQSCGNTRVPG
jgi:hypothetical protein